MPYFTRVCLLLVLSFFATVANAQLSASFNADPEGGCVPLLVSFTSTSTGTTSSTTYSWDFGSGAPAASGSTASTTYNTTGTYTVTLTVHNGSATSTATKTITVYPKPTVSFSATPTVGCPDLCVSFTDHSTPNAPGAATYLWDFGDGLSATSATATHCFPTGYYNVALRVINSEGCEASLEKDSFVHVLGHPAANFTATNTHFCNPTAHAIFSNSTTGINPLTYSWSFGSTATNPTHDYTTTGSFDVTLVATDSNGCKDTLTRPGYIVVGHPHAGFTASKTSACIGDSISFTNTTTGSYASSYWYFGDGSTDNNVNTGHRYGAAGTYTVTLVVHDGYTCADTFTKTITINPSPVAVITQTPRYPCAAPQTIDFTGSGATNYTWDYGDGSPTGSGSSASHYYTSNGIYIVTLTATNSSGCRDTAIDTVALYNLRERILAYPKREGCSPLTVYFSENVLTDVPFQQLYPYPISTYSWDFGDGSPLGSGPFPSHTFTDTGKFIVHLTITSAGGCTVTDTFSIRVGSRPIASFYTDKDTLCVHQMLTFHNTSQHANEGDWNFDDNTGPDDATNPVHMFGDTGVFHVRLIAYDNGCPDTAYHDIFIPPPVADLHDTIMCDSPGRQWVIFSDTGSIGMTYHKWFLGDGDTSNGDHFMHHYPTSSTYDIMMVAYNSYTGCHDTAATSIDLRIPTASLDADDTEICPGNPVLFTGHLSVIGQKWTWDANGLQIGFNPTLNTLIDTFRVKGCYDIVLYVQDPAGCWDTAERPDYITVGKPIAGFKATPVIGCSPLAVTFTDTSTDVACTGIYKRRWVFGTGDSAIVTTANTTYVYQSPGVDSVQLIVTDSAGCKDTLTRYDYVVSLKPHAEFLASNTLPCRFENVIFNNYSTVDVAHDTLSRYWWDFGDGDTSTQKSPSHKYRDTGTYTVRLIVEDVHGCRDTMTRAGYIFITNPQAAFAMDDSVRICPPLFVQFTNHTVGATSYLWIMGDGTSVSVANPTHLFTSPGYFVVKLVATDAHGCTDTAIGHVNIYGYAGALTYTPDSGCAPLFVNFTASVTNAPLIVWDFSDGHTESMTGSTTTTHIYLSPGAYVPKLLLGDGKGCKSESVGLDTIKVDGVIAGYYAYPPCVGDTVQFFDTSKSFFSPVTSWAWTFDDFSTSTDKNPSRYYGATGRYYLQLIAVNKHGCRDTLTDSVTIYPLPVISAGTDTVICVGDAATLYPAGGTSYVWSPNVHLSCDSCTNPLASPPVPTTYTVIGTDVHGCSNWDTVTVSLKTKATGMVDSAGDLCAGLSERLHAYGAHTYTWLPPTGLDSNNVPDPLASPTDTITYMVIGKEGSCIPDTVYTTVIVHPKPTVNAGQDQTIIEGDFAQLQATGNYVTTYSWSPADNLNCSDCSNPRAKPLATTIYAVTGISDYGCRDTDSVTVNVLCDKSQVFIPNSFTPNGDGQNDVFYPRGVGITIIKSFRIYNRWGQLIFERSNININDESNGWDGNYMGSAQGPGVFVYMVDAICQSGQEIHWKGDVTIIR